MNPDSSSPDSVQEAVHLLARNYDALDDTVRRLLLTDDDQSTLLFGVPSVEKAGSLYGLLNERLRLHRLTPSQTFRVLSFVLRELDRHHALLLNLTESYRRDEQLRLRRRDVDLQELLNEIVELFEGPAAEKGVEIRLNVRGTPMIFGDRQLLYRLFMNLVDNAVKYSYTRTDRVFRHVDIQCRRHTAEGDWLVIVESYGVGVLPEEISTGRIYEYGQRGQRARDRSRIGSGIGLAEAKRIAEAHGGALKLESKRAGKDESPDTETTPYITTVSVQIPAGGRS